MALVRGLGEGRADAEADGLDPELVEIVARRGFRRRSSTRRRDCQGGSECCRRSSGALVKADGVNGAGIDDALDAMLPCRLIDIVAADDIGVEDGVPGALRAPDRPYERWRRSRRRLSKRRRGRKGPPGLSSSCGLRLSQGLRADSLTILPSLVPDLRSWVPRAPAAPVRSVR